MKKILTILFLTATSLMITSCITEHNTENKQEKPTLNQSGPEYTSHYICPMRCPKSGSDKMGQCPVCHMDYVENKKHEDYGKTN